MVLSLVYENDAIPIPDLCVIRSDIVIMHWHSIPAPVRHKNVLLKRQHKHADKLHLYAIKLRHWLTLECFFLGSELCWGEEAMVLIIHSGRTSAAEILMKYTQTVTFVKSYSKLETEPTLVRKKLEKRGSDERKLVIKLYRCILCWGFTVKRRDGRESVVFFPLTCLISTFSNKIPWSKRNDLLKELNLLSRWYGLWVKRCLTCKLAVCIGSWWG